jgi:3-hydroxyacyl-[acyl-carrier-protein] dehydratase
MSEQDPVELGLPHREPFVFVDAVLELTPGQAATCRKTFPASLDFFRGHFPGDPLVPGVILTEALAQTAGIAAGEPGKAFRLSAIRSMKFLRAVRPDDTVTLTARKLGGVGGLLQFETSAHVGDALVAEGNIVLSEP